MAYRDDYVSPEGPVPAAERAAPAPRPPERIIRLRSSSVGQTRSLGHRLGELAADGWVILLEGPLGAGKTAFAQGLLAGAGVRAQVTSPTFTLINEYQGRLPVWHADLYRLEDAPVDFAAIGGDELLPPRCGLTVVEWAERLGGLAPAEHIRAVLSQPQADRRGRPSDIAAQTLRDLRLEFRGRDCELAAVAFAATLPSLLARAPGAPAAIEGRGQND